MRISIYPLMILVVLTLAMTGDGRKYPTDDFISPVKHSLKLSGTFGELRSNHFHAGLDIKSEKGIAGDPVYAAYNGFVSRIKVEEYGYGNALYIEHPNGFTTLYAHLLNFSPEIEAYVKTQQYKQKSFEVNLYPDKGQFSFDQHEQIGNMGNTGSSGGAHLHFEIRHTEGQIPINPLLFGLPVADQKKPVIQQLMVYEFDASGNLLRTSVVTPRLQTNGNYILNQPLALSTEKIAFSLRTYDSQDGSTNQNGIYGLECKVDNEPSFAFVLDEISFETSRYINAHIDYEKKVEEGRYYHRCYPLEGNKLPIYFIGKEKGYIHINTDTTRHIDLAITDFMNNVSTLSFDIKRQLDFAPQLSDAPPCDMVAAPNEVNVLSKPGIQAVWTKGTFYEKTPVNLSVEKSDNLSTYSPYFTLSPAGVPVHYYYDINIEGLSVPKNLLDKAFIARCQKNEACVSVGGNWIGNNLHAEVRQMGTYTIMVDTIAPRITPIRFNEKMTGWQRMTFKISDNFEINDRGRDLLYKGYVDGEWILFSLDGKTGLLTHEFDEHIAPGEHRLMLKVIDDRGNEAVFEKSFTL